jgi:Skp family chaperone for outer membrane proteins
MTMNWKPRLGGREPNANGVGVLLPVLLLGTATPGTAQEPAADARPGLRIADLTTLREQGQKQGVSQGAADRDDKERQIRVKERDLQAFIEDGRAEIESLQQRVQQEAESLRNEYQGKMRPHIEAVARQQGIDFLIDAAITLQLNGAYDISRDVIAHADAAEPAGRTAP